jgi:outer membrane immunogenic protein
MATCKKYRKGPQTAQVGLGWTIGAGIEHAFTASLSLKAEYLYVDFGNEEFTTTNVNNSDQTLKHSFDLDMHIVRLGLNWRF